MQSIKELGFANYYYLNGTKIYNIRTQRYMKEVAPYRYKLVTEDGTKRSITIKEIYRRLYNKNFCIDNVERLEGEEFREIDGTEGNYLVSNKGRVISCMGNYAVLLKATITNKGYERLQIIIDGERYNKFVHTLVACAWLDKPERIDCEVHHKNFNCLDNCSTNLIYVKPEEHRKIHNEKRRNKCQSTIQIQTKEA